MLKMKKQLKAKEASILIISFVIIIYVTEGMYLLIITQFNGGYHYWVSRLILFLMLSILLLVSFKLFNVKLTNRVVKPTLKEVFLIVGTALTSIVAFLIFSFPREFINSIFLSYDIVQLPGNNYMFIKSLQYVIINCILFPILEEIFWREILLRKLIQHYNQTKVILILSVVFGVLHFKPSFAALILLSIIASYIYVKSNSLVLAIIYHSLWNFFNFLFSFFREQLSSILISFWYIPIFFIGGIIIWLLLKKFGDLQGENTSFRISEKDLSQGKP